MLEKNTLVCAGLDPDIQKMPVEIGAIDGTDEEKIYTFLKTVVEITAPHVCAYKIQKAFFDPLKDGHALLESVVTYIKNRHPGIPVFIDCKIGDIDNTMQAYMHNLFDIIGASGVVVNPYMGDDVMAPFIEDESKVGIILVQTSNPKAKIIQETRLENGKKLWEEILDLVLERWNTNNNLIPVLSSNVEGANYTNIREKIPSNIPILLAGIGSQGGDPAVLRQLLNKEGRGVFVNSSRAILYPYQKDSIDWRESILNAVVKIKNELNEMRKTENIAPAVKLRFLLLLGPSGVGKTTLINALKKIDSRFEYVTPLTTRELRPQETDKVHVSLEEIKELEQSNNLLAVNQFYGIYYATPKIMIDRIFSENKFPILDWPVSKIQIMKQHYGDRLFVVYVSPENEDELKAQLANDARDKDGLRIKSGLEELEQFYRGDFEDFIDLKVVNKKNASTKVAEDIYLQFIKS